MLKTAEIVQGTEVEEEQKRQKCSVCLFLTVLRWYQNLVGAALGSAELCGGR